MCILIIPTQKVPIQKMCTQYAYCILQKYYFPYIAMVIFIFFHQCPNTVTKLCVFLPDFSREKHNPSLCGLPRVKERSDTFLVCFCIYWRGPTSPSLGFNWESHLTRPGVTCRGLRENSRSTPSFYKCQHLRLLMQESPTPEREEGGKEVDPSIHLILLGSKYP